MLVCTLGLGLGETRRRPPRQSTGIGAHATWSRVVTGVLGIPPLPTLATDGTIGDRARCSLNFRDEYYGLVPAVSDDGDGPPLVTSGLIDPGRCLWGERPVRFAKREFAAARVELARLDAHMRAWARRKLVPKVLVANQTRIIEAVADPEGVSIPACRCSSLVPSREARRLGAGRRAHITRRRGSRLARRGRHRALGPGDPARTGHARRHAPGRQATSHVARGSCVTATSSGADWPSPAAYASSRAHTERTAGDPADDALFEWWASTVNVAAVVPDAGRHPLPTGRPGDHPQQHKPDQLAEVHGLLRERCTHLVGHVEHGAQDRGCHQRGVANGSIPKARWGRHAA